MQLARSGNGQWSKVVSGLSRTCLFLICVLALIEILGIALDAFADEKMIKKGRWWKDDQLVKNAIVSYLKFEQTAPLRSDSDLSQDIAHLLLLYDSMSTPESMATLTSLNWYYLGEFPSEIYSCLLVRKGQQIKKHLTNLLALDRNECVERLGAGSKGCRTNDEMKREVKIILKRIDSKEPCEIEQ